MDLPRTTMKRLYALSQNRCAFPSCALPIVETSGTITGIICHIKARSPGGPRYDKRQTPEERQAYENLLLLCARHSKVIDSEPKVYTVESLQEMKRKHEQPSSNDLTTQDGRNIDLLVTQYRDLYVEATNAYFGTIHAQHAEFHSPGRPNVAAPEGSIGSDLLRRNYTKHLIDRYNHFASKQPNRNKFAFPAIYSITESRYGVKKWELVPMQHFQEFCEYLRERIDKTWLGCVQRSKGKKCYSSLDEYRVKYFERAKQKK